MPIYDYKCPKCGNITEFRHHMDDDVDAICTRCDEHMDRVPCAATLRFVGSGFYETDYKRTDCPGD